jgi:hypothetical protein
MISSRINNAWRKPLATVSAFLFLSTLPAEAVSILNLTTNTVLFKDDFESGLTPSSPSIGSWSIFGPDVTVTNASSPGPAQGSFYAQLFRDSDTTNQGNLQAAISSVQATNGDLIRLSMMVFFPSTTDADARAQLMLDNGDFNSARAWVIPDGAGHVLAVGPGFATTDTQLTYSTNTWQEWDLQYAIGASTFSVTVNGVTASGFTSATTGAVGFADLFNGIKNPAGSFYLDAVPQLTTAAPEPASLLFMASGLAVIGFARRGSFRFRAMIFLRAWPIVNTRELGVDAETLWQAADKLRRQCGAGGANDRRQIV